MRRVSMFLVVALLAAGSARGAAGDTPPSPLDIAGTAGAVPDGWTFSSAPAGEITAAVSVQDCGAEPRCVRFAPVHQNVFARGSLKRSIYAAPYRGKRIRFRVEARTASQTYSGITTSLAVIRAGGATGYAETADERAVRDAAWAPVVIVADVAADAETIRLGITPSYTAVSLAAAPSIEIVGAAPADVVAPPAPLTEREKQNLLALTRVLRMVRHFHPSDQVAATQWQTFTVNAVRTVLPAKDPAALAGAMTGLFTPIAPTMRVGRAGDPKPVIASPAGATRTVHWVHTGFGHGEVSAANGAYFDQRLDGPLAAPEIVRVPLDGDYVADVPLQVAADGESTLPRAQPLVLGTTADGSDARDRAVHLAGVIDAWEVIKTFSPYLDRLPGSWDDVLSPMLAEAATGADAKAYAYTLRHLIHALQDGHGYAASPDASKLYAPQATVTRVGQDVVVDRAATSTELKPGDVIVTVDGRPVQDVWNEFAARASGSPQWIAQRVQGALLTSDREVPVVLGIRRGSAESTVSVARGEYAPLADAQPATGTELRPGIIYVDLTRATVDAVNALRPRLAQAHGIIFDMRGYPSSSQPNVTVFPYLTHDTLQSARWNIPVITHPDVVDSWDTRGRWSIPPQAPYLAAKRVFITDGSAISYAESVMGIVEAYTLGEIVGETTAGTNGNINTIPLPAGYSMIFTGMKVLKHDGSVHHLVGIAPTIPVHRTIAGIAAGRDEMLEAALAAAGG